MGELGVQWDPGVPPMGSYTLVLTPHGGDRNYTWSDIVSFRIALGNDKLRCVYGSQTYGTFIFHVKFPVDVVVIIFEYV